MKVKSQRGSISIFVLIALLFYMAFLLLLYANNLNKVQTISEKVEILKNIYRQNYDNVDEVYNRYKGVQVGDYVNYDELSNGKKTYSVDYTQNGGTSNTNSQTFETEDLGWRVLDIADNGQITLISDNPTTATLYLRGENGYLNGEDILNNTCNELYGKGYGAESARSLNVYDINKIANVANSKGTTKIYRFPEEGDYLQYSNDGGVTWKDITDPNYQTFRMPGETEMISADNRSDEGISFLHEHYYYTISQKILDISLVNMLEKGTGESNITQWLATSTFYQYWNYYVGADLQKIQNDTVMEKELYNVRGWDLEVQYAFRPVVTLNSNVQLVKDTATDTWNIQ